MTKQSTVNWGLGLLAGAAVGATALFLARRSGKKELVGQLEDMADQARETTGGWARSLRDKAIPIIMSVADLVESNADLVSAFANISAEQVRKTGQEIRQAAPTIERTLDALGSI